MNWSDKLRLQLQYSRRNYYSLQGEKNRKWRKTRKTLFTYKACQKANYNYNLLLSLLLLTNNL